jgi:hypothetical protein
MTSSSDSEEQYIPILYRHLYRRPDESDREKVALKISYQLILDAIQRAEATQRTVDSKRRLYFDSDDEENISEILSRKRAKLT